MSYNQTLSIKNLVVSVEETEVLHGINLEVPAGQIHAIMGPNGSGKTTLSQVIMGHPAYTVHSGEIWYGDQNITTLTPDKRARLGVFLAFQYPKEIPGIKLFTFLRTIYNNRMLTQDPGYKKLSTAKFKPVLEAKMAELQMSGDFIERYLNSGFSGGEKKKAEMLQMALLEPGMAILDETDSGLDIDALKIVCQSVNTLHAQTKMGVLLITHYNRILNYITPDQVHVLIDGRIARSGGAEFAAQVEEQGYDWLRT